MTHPFDSFFSAGFPGAQHRTRAGQVDEVAATGHADHLLNDYRRCADAGIYTVREAVRGIAVERNRKRGRPAFDHLLKVREAAAANNVQIVWDLFHYELPERMRLLQDERSTNYVRVPYARDFGNWLWHKGERNPVITPMNEIGHLAHMAAEVGAWWPFAVGRGAEARDRLIRAAIGAARDLRGAVRPNFAWAESVFVHPDGKVDPGLYYIYDRLIKAGVVDVVGLNIYPDSWRHIPYTGEGFLQRNIKNILMDVWKRYRKPIWISETQAMAEGRADWLRHVCQQVRAAQAAGVLVAGVCLYPIIPFPDWERGTFFHPGGDVYDGLWGLADEHGHRPIYQPLADELARQQAAFSPYYKGYSR